MLDLEFAAIPKRWSVEGLSWDRFQPEKVNSRLTALAKSASLVEYNSGDYVTYLLNVFRDYPEMFDEIKRWGAEERLHGEALRAWCEKADPSFDFKAAFKNFLEAYRVPIDVAESVRGSLSQELVARCVVEAGTTTYYTALKDFCEEPVLKEICRRIAADEGHHYRFFMKYLEDKFLPLEGVGRYRRFKTTLKRVIEASDEELTAAFCAVNPDLVRGLSTLKAKNDVYFRTAAPIYRPRHLMAAIILLFRAAGVKPRPWLTNFLTRNFWRALQFRFCRQG